jgi:succinate-semialdehyde dehydrogenase/glutarate-semialdehyde dehydrogenase
VISVNPTTEKQIAEYPDHSGEQVEQFLDDGAAAKKEWRRSSFQKRASLMREVTNLLRQRQGELARLMTAEMGKPIVAAEAEIAKCAGCCEYFSEHAEKFLAQIPAPSDAWHSYVKFEPVGLVLAIMPWNFPFWQVFRFAAPALMAGNVGLLKHAPNVPGCALAIADIFNDAGFPPGAFSSVLISDNAIAQHLAGHPAVDAVTLTGSEKAGSRVAAEAGGALKKTVMELGGSDAFIVLADAQIESVAKSAAEARCLNNGQSCIAAKRFIVEESVAAKFESAIVAVMNAFRIGDPMDRATQIGPLARLDLLENLDHQVRHSVRQGAKLLAGGNRLERKGFFYPPTVLSDVHPGMVAFDEETFGPVAAIIRAKDAADAVRLANLSRYGLGASIWTNDLARAEALAGQLECGSVFVNGPVKSDPRLPFGGIKKSGWGRELGDFGIREFVNVKTVWIGK